MMDINLLRSIVTLLAFVTFVGIVIWAWHPRRKADFAQAAHLPFTAETAPEDMQSE